MEDIQVILYILAAVAYFIITQWRKAFSGDNDDDAEPKRPRPRPQQPPKPVTSFEDILRELQPKLDQAKRQGQEVVQQAKDHTRELAQPATASVAEAAPKYKSYENVAPKVLSWEKRAEAMEAARQSKFRSSESVKSYEQRQPAKVSRYAQMLRNPATARDAVILSEIFNRKYN